MAARFEAHVDVHPDSLRGGGSTQTAGLRRNRQVEEKTPHFQFRAQVDPISVRLKVIPFQSRDVGRLWQRLLALAQAERLTKIVLYARPDDWQRFLAHGFVLEAMIDGYWGDEPAFCMAYFLDGDRQATDRFDDQQALLEKVLAAEEEPAPPLPAGYRMVRCSEAMAPDLAALFSQVFETYPMPLYDPDYLAELIREGKGIFRAVLNTEGEIASAAAAEFEKAAAEITNCATLPAHRGEGLMRLLIEALEDDCRSDGVDALFSIARARSFGMNLALRRAGYRYRGRLINNTEICGGFEDMNVWVKDNTAD